MKYPITKNQTYRMAYTILGGVVDWWCCPWDIGLAIHRLRVRVLAGRAPSRSGPRRTTLWTEKNTKMFFVIPSTKPSHSGKIWYTLSLINLRYSSLNVFQLTWIMSLHYLVKLSGRHSHFVSEQQLEMRTQKTHRMFLSHRLQKQADSDKILYFLSRIYLPQSIINVSYSN